MSETLLIDQLGHNEVQGTLEKRLEGCVGLSYNRVQQTQDLEILGQQKQIQEGLDDHVEIRGLEGVLSEVPRLQREELLLQVRQGVVQADMNEFPFRGAEVIDEPDKVEHFLLKVHGEAVLKVERRSLAKMVDEDTGCLV